MFDYLEETIAPLISYNLDDYRYFSLFGFTTMRVPFKAVPGFPSVPGYSFQGDEKSGIYNPFVGGVGIALGGLPGAIFQHDLGRAYFDLYGKYFRGRFSHELTADREWTMPDRSGVVALEPSITKVNAEAFSIQAGQPVTLSGSDSCLLALADTYDTCCVGLAISVTGSGGTVSIMLSGTLELADWSNVIGSTTLTTNNEYFTSHATPGALTDISPDTDGLFSQYVGKALSPTIMDIRVERPYEL